MTTEEKLQHFYDVSVGEAKNSAKELVEAHKENLDQQFADYTKKKDKENEQMLKAESDNAAREINKSLSASQLEIKRSWSKKQNALKDQLFEEVLARLTAFHDGPDYEAYLMDKIKAALDFANGDDVDIYLSANDADKKDSLSKATGTTLLVSDQDFIGGIQARIPAENILIDNSFQNAFKIQKHNFAFDGGLINE